MHRSMRSAVKIFIILSNELHSQHFDFVLFSIKLGSNPMPTLLSIRRQRGAHPADLSTLGFRARTIVAPGTEANPQAHQAKGSHGEAAQP